MRTIYSHYSLKRYKEGFVKIDQMPWSQHDCCVLLLNCIHNLPSTINSITAVLLLSKGVLLQFQINKLGLVDDLSSEE